MRDAATGDEPGNHPGNEPSRASTTDDRHETPTERMDRNWSELLQELRVTQTGSQVLTGFLLTVPFQQRFTELEPLEVDVYLLLVLLSVLSTGLLVAPVSLHRFMFRRHLKAETVTLGHRLARTGLAVLGLTIVGTVYFLFDVVVGRAAGAAAGGCVLAVLAVLWVVVPWLAARQAPVRRDDES
ncbi:DUF6328 family protein [Luteimicrobium subarcticum]|uniref:Sodium:proton antiporter n=1 Tax=Luteimicrobium subarcticum TaxID=620910 RepID=A0A2M8W3R9_9MICO|nr:DUF6328 family protein [Luteimicrobium subarcticum]PJI85572.1 hypothetical protein CLV34_2754 [Luteimicrobium subarcticum]